MKTISAPIRICLASIPFVFLIVVLWTPIFDLASDFVGTSGASTSVLWFAGLMPLIALLIMGIGLYWVLVAIGETADDD